MQKTTIIQEDDDQKSQIYRHGLYQHGPSVSQKISQVFALADVQDAQSLQGGEITRKDSE